MHKNLHLFYVTETAFKVRGTRPTLNKVLVGWNAVMEIFFSLNAAAGLGAVFLLPQGVAADSHDELFKVAPMNLGARRVQQAQFAWYIHR